MSIAEIPETVSETLDALRAELQRAQARIAALEQLLEVHEQTSLEQATRLEGSLADRVEALEHERAARLRLVQKTAELAQTTEELERSNRELDQFAYVASHDLKAPLRGIANLTEWIEEDIGENLSGESLEHMKLLKGRVHRMEALIDGILAYSRAGRTREKVEEIDVAALIRETIELLSPPETTRVQVASQMPRLITERVPLQQVFINLIGNAIKYNQSRDGLVEIDCADADDGFVRFSVRDNGPGIAPEFQQKVWQIFQTLAPRDQVESTGIGLAVVQKLVEVRGGRVGLESAPGQGSTFYFSWPRTARTRE